MARAVELIGDDVSIALFMGADSRQSEEGGVARSHHGALVADVDDLADGGQAGELRDRDRDRTADRRVRIAAGSAVRRRTDLSVAATLGGDESGRGERAAR